ncbi:gpW family head-tail joining protein [Kiloniella laminariae]|uniref:gpW family head-tail joining protein n=1 Tax=Kiloniella laminariae TaxID=454162 RepID=UPI000372A501|nr:gpW family head-tail joining protein [Kiloniella laminariae]
MALDKQALEAELRALEFARTKILTGASRASVSFNGNSVSFQAANMADIQQRITEIKIALGSFKKGPTSPRFSL